MIYTFEDFPAHVLGNLKGFIVGCTECWTKCTASNLYMDDDDSLMLYENSV